MSHHHPPAVSWHEARELLHAAASALTPTLSTEALPLQATIGRYVAEDLTARMPVPHYSSSAMDGYAVAGAPPWRLVSPDYPEDARTNVHRLAVPITAGEATPILTGGLLPEGTEAIVREEHSHRYEGAGALGSGIHYLDMAEGYTAPEPGTDIRYAGAELSPGAILSSRGDLITAQRAAFLGVNGFDELPVLKNVPVRCAFTGNEVITFGMPSPGQVRDAFGGFLEVSLAAAGCEVRPSARLADIAEEFHTFVTTSTARILIFTGGSSTSGVDMVRQTLTDIGAEYIFESVRVRPGHPALAAKIPAPTEGMNAGQERLVLGLPGNPLAAYTALYSYLPVILAGLRGLQIPALDRAELATDIPPLRKRSQHRLMPVRVSEGKAYPLDALASHMLSGLAQATHFALVDATGQRAGTHAILVPVF